MSEYELDAANLAVADVSVVSGERRSEKDMHAAATKGVRTLLGELAGLPTVTKRGKKEAATTLVELPAPVMKLPREKAPPKEKPMTAWQKFALKKGIALNRKKTNRVYDEERHEWKDKWGKRAREDERKHDWIREVKPNYASTEEGGDPFLDDRRAKQKRLEKQKKNEEKNQKRADAADRATAEVSHLSGTLKNIATASNGKFAKKIKPRK